MTDRRSDEIDRIVEEFLAAERGEADIDATCTQHAQIATELRQALRDALRVRQARERAMQPPSGSENGERSEDADSPRRRRQIGKYTLGALIGGGGFGEVYEATANGRIVAIKVLKAEHDEKADIIHRFRKEAEILQKLGHQGIVPVYEVGEDHGRPYIVMKRVQGLDLHRHSRARPIEAREAARLIAEAADACDYANRAGVIHRDLKPENILIDETGRVVVTDFGLAKRLDSKTELTLSLQRLGTPHYMAPEQADRRLGPITPRCDVYSLGATLYFLLAGRPPFPREDDTGRDATLEEIKWDEPKPPREHNGAVPPPLELICLQCLEKWPGCRPSSAAALADDLRNFLAGKPVNARLPGRATRLRVWCIRHPVPTAVLGIAAAALVTGSALSLHFADKAASSAAETQAQKDLTAAAEGREKTASRERLRRQYLADMRDAQAALTRGETPIALRLLAKYETPASTDDPRAFEWYYLNQLAHTPSPVHINKEGVVWNRLTLSPTGDRIACVDRAGTLTVFRLPDGSEVFRASEPVIDCAFVSDGSKLVALAAAEQGKLVIMDAATGAVSNEVFTERLTTCMALSPDGTTCFTGDVAGNLYLWSLNGGHQTDLAKDHKRGMYERSLDIQHGAVTAAAYSPDGRLLAVGYEDGASQVWEIARSRIVTRAPGQTGAVVGVTFSPDSARVASQSFGRYIPQLSSNTHGNVQVWNAATGVIEQTVVPHQAMLANSPVIDGGPFGVPFGQLRPCFTADGTEIITTGPLSAQRWTIATGRLAGSFTGDGSLVRALATSGDGRFLAAASESGGVRVWPAQAPESVGVLFSTSAGIRSLCGDGKRLAAVYEDGMEMTVGEHGQLFSRSERRGALLWDLATSQETKRPGLKANLDTVTMLPGAFLCGDIAIGETAEASVSELVSEIQQIGNHSAIAVSGDGRWIGVGHADGSVQLLSTDDHNSVWTVHPHQGEVTALAFSPDNSALASGGTDRRIYILKRESGEVAATLQGHRREIGGLAFSPDGKRLASGSGLLRIASTQGGEVRLWDVAAEQPCLELIAGPADVYPGVAWSADSARLFAAANSVTGAEGRVDPGRVLVWEIRASDAPGGPSAPPPP